jgi:hypothetical protein
MHRWIADAVDAMVQEPARAVLKMELAWLDELQSKASFNGDD